MGKRRDRLYIISVVLKLAKNEILKTQIMYKANLSFTQLNEYIGLMMEKDLLKKIKIQRREKFKITKKGVDFLQSYININKFLIRKRNE